MADRSPSRKPRPRQPARTARDEVLAEWRGIDLGPLERAQTLAARPVSQIMPDVVQKLALDRRQTETEIRRVWNHLIDPTIVAHAQPTGLRNGTLFVSVDSSVWLDEIVRYRRKEILTRLQHSFGRVQIARISFRAG